MQIGRSTSRPDRAEHVLEQLGLVDQRDAGVDVEHVGAGGDLGDRVGDDGRQVAARSSSANALRPVGLIRSPITQNGWSWPMTTV